MRDVSKVNYALILWDFPHPLHLGLIVLNHSPAPGVGQQMFVQMVLHFQGGLDPSELKVVSTQL